MFRKSVVAIAVVGAAALMSAPAAQAMSADPPNVVGMEQSKAFRVLDDDDYSAVVTEQVGEGDTCFVTNQKTASHFPSYQNPRGAADVLLEVQCG